MFLRALACLILLPTLAACADGESPPREAQPVATPSGSVASDLAEVVKAGFGQSEEFIWYGALVRSRTAEAGASVTVRFVLKDASGAAVQGDFFLDTLTEYFTRPGQTIVVGFPGEVPVGTEVATVEATVLAVEPDSSVPESPDFKAGPVLDLRADSIGQYTGTVEITNPTPELVPRVQVGLVCLNEGGDIIGGGTDEVDLRPAGTTRFFPDSVLTSGPPARCEAYPGGPILEGS